MPEAKFRTVKKGEKPLSSIRTSEFAAELKARKTAVSGEPAVELADTLASKAAAEPEGKTEVEAKTLPASKSKKAEEAKFSYVSFWPIAVGLFLSGFAPEWASIAAQAGIWVVRFTFPFALLAMHREIGIDNQMAMVLPQMAVYAQLPIDGALLMLSYWRSKSLLTSIFQVTAIHAVCAFVLWLVATGAR